jgi:hypothetical protein
VEKQVVAIRGMVVVQVAALQVPVPALGTH